MKNFIESLIRPTGKPAAAALFGMLGALGPSAAFASVALPELHGVPEQLGAHRLVVDGAEIWALVLLVGVVAALWIFHRKDRSK